MKTVDKPRMTEIFVGDRYISNKGEMGEVIAINDVLMLAIKLNGKTLKTYLPKKLKKEDWTKL